MDFTPFLPGSNVASALPSDDSARGNVNITCVDTGITEYTLLLLNSLTDSLLREHLRLTGALPTFQPVVLPSSFGSTPASASQPSNDYSVPPQVDTMNNMFNFLLPHTQPVGPDLALGSPTPSLDPAPSYSSPLTPPPFSTVSKSSVSTITHTFNAMQKTDVRHALPTTGFVRNPFMTGSNLVAKPLFTLPMHSASYPLLPEVVPSQGAAIASFPLSPNDRTSSSNPVSNAHKHRARSVSPLSDVDPETSRRTKLSRANRQHLVQLFEEDHQPPTEVLKVAARKVGKSLRHVQYFFQNRRAALRRRGRQLVVKKGADEVEDD
ncbi:hypothetical protein BC830DRAFT_1127499 [Chytriomyces sp. MP71]|nr:hypothetical protein BC830DRAFT_1127499 [Chytriomyces sp. MP71]